MKVIDILQQYFELVSFTSLGVSGR